MNEPSFLERKMMVDRIAGMMIIFGCIFVPITLMIVLVISLE